MRFISIAGEERQALVFDNKLGEAIVKLKEIMGDDSPEVGR
jgi:hypothetical protein